MKLFANKKLFKKIIILLVVIMMLNILIPLYNVSADTDEDFGGALFRPICQLLAGLGDLVIQGLQWMFIGSSQIKTAEIDLLQDGIYKIRYSPGVIFSNTVPGLDANFINPGDSLQVTDLAGTVTNIGEYYFNSTDEFTESLGDTYGFNWDDVKFINSNTTGDVWSADKTNVIYEWTSKTNSNITYMLINQSVDYSNYQWYDWAFFTSGIKSIDFAITNRFCLAFV